MTLEFLDRLTPTGIYSFLGIPELLVMMSATKSPETQFSTPSPDVLSVGLGTKAMQLLEQKALILPSLFVPEK